MRGSTPSRFRFLRTARTATLTIVDELTRALPAISEACRTLPPDEGLRLIGSHDNKALLRAAFDEMEVTLDHVLD
jgi:4-phosphopantoate--beta-alanine ligase